MVNPASLPGDSRIHGDARLHGHASPHGKAHRSGNGQLALENTSTADMVVAAMWEELGNGRLDELPLADRGRLPDHLPKISSAKPATNNPWAHHVFDDVDPSLEGLDDMHGGMLYRQRRAAEAAAAGSHSAGRYPAGNPGVSGVNTATRGSAMSRGVGGGRGMNGHGTRAFTHSMSTRDRGGSEIGRTSARTSHHVDATIARLRTPPEVATSSRGGNQQGFINRRSLTRVAPKQASFNRQSPAHAPTNASGPSRFAIGSNLASADAFMAHFHKPTPPMANQAPATISGFSSGLPVQVPAREQGLLGSSWASGDAVASQESTPIPYSRTLHTPAIPRPPQNTSSRQTVAGAQDGTPITKITPNVATQAATTVVTSQPLPDTTPSSEGSRFAAPVKIVVKEQKRVRVRRNSGPTVWGSIAFYTVSNFAGIGILEIVMEENAMSGPVSERDTIEVAGTMMKYRPVGDGTPTWRLIFEFDHLAMGFYDSVVLRMRTCQRIKQNVAVGEEEIVALQEAPSSDVQRLSKTPSTVALPAALPLSMDASSIKTPLVKNPSAIPAVDGSLNSQIVVKYPASVSAASRDLDQLDSQVSLLIDFDNFDGPERLPSKSTLDLNELLIDDHIVEELLKNLNKYPEQSYLKQILQIAGPVSLNENSPELLAGAESIVSAFLNQDESFQNLAADMKTAYIANYSKRTLQLAISSQKQIERGGVTVKDDDNEPSDIDYCNGLQEVPDVFHDAVSKLDSRKTYAREELYGLRSNATASIQGELAQKSVYKLISPTRRALPAASTIIQRQSAVPLFTPNKPAPAGSYAFGAINLHMQNAVQSTTGPSISQKKPANATSFGPKSPANSQKQSDPLREVFLSAVRGEDVQEARYFDSKSDAVIAGRGSRVGPNAIKFEIPQRLPNQHRTGLSRSLGNLRLEEENLIVPLKTEEEKSFETGKTEVTTDNKATPHVPAVSDTFHHTGLANFPVPYLNSRPSTDQVLGVASASSGAPSRKIDSSKMGGLSSSMWAPDTASRFPLVKKKTANGIGGGSESSVQPTSQHGMARGLTPEARPLATRPAVQAPTLFAHGPAVQQDNAPFPTGPATNFNRSAGGFQRRRGARHR